MLSSEIGKKILDGFCRSNASEIDFNISNAYLGLLTTLPKDDESAYEDGTFFAEPTDVEYHRVRLNDINPLEEKEYIDSAIEDDNVNSDEVGGVLPAYVINPTYIMFPEPSESWGDIVGFGIYRVNSGTTLPYIWGPISALEDENTTVTIDADEIPIIRAGNFKISLR